jgi:D-lyxose ketol-isomerase
MRRINKAWGYEEVLVNEPEYCAKMLHLDAGKMCSLHFHKTKKETFIVLMGLVRLEWSQQDELLRAREARTLLPGMSHRFSSAHGAVILEISTHHDDADVVRLEPSGEAKVLAGRAGDRASRDSD